jgi:hypothetical protein
MTAVDMASSRLVNEVWGVHRKQQAQEGKESRLHLKVNGVTVLRLLVYFSLLGIAC